MGLEVWLGHQQPAGEKEQVNELFHFKGRGSESTPHPCYINKETFVPTSTLNSHSQTRVIEGSTQAAADFYDTTALITAPDGGRCEALYKWRRISQKPY